MSIIESLDRLVARIRIRNWKSPDWLCGMCGEPYDRLVAHHTGDGWWYAWECTNYCGWNEDGPQEWPWIRSSVWGKDWEAVGVEVV